MKIVAGLAVPIVVSLMLNEVRKEFVKRGIHTLGFQPVYFLGDNGVLPFVLVVSDVWKEFGFSTIVFLAELTAINPALYEAAIVDGASRWKQTLHITLPGMMPIIVLMATLSLGNVLNAGFDQVFNLYSPQIYESGDIIDTLVYRIGLVDAHTAYKPEVVEPDPLGAENSFRRNEVEGDCDAEHQRHFDLAHSFTSAVIRSPPSFFQTATNLSNRSIG